jgi:hypothetical protein
VKELFNKWNENFSPMELAAKLFLETPNDQKRSELLEAHTKFIEMSKRNNVKFLILCMNAYQSSLSA